MKIIFLTPRSSLISKTAFFKGIGGNETTIVLWGEYLSRIGHEVVIYSSDTNKEEVDNIKFLHWNDYISSEVNCDVLIACRQPELLKGPRLAKVQILYLGDRTIENTNYITPDTCDLIWYVSHTQFELLHHKFDPNVKYYIGTCGVDDSLFNLNTVKRPLSFAHTSIPYRGLSRVLSIWPLIREYFPDATIDITSDYTLWGYSECQSNTFRKQDLSIKHESQLSHSNNGIFFHGALPRNKYISVLSSCQYLLYITEYEEMCCISALEAAALGGILFLSPVAALKERVLDNVTGLYVESELSDSEIAKKIYDIVQSDRVNFMSIESRNRAMDYSTSNTVNKLMQEIYEIYSK
ncbi:glycosyltransferase [Acinetobacter sp. AOR15_HL]|uniref:glycosyltransferase n=1 Tax=unclassified Acinetobacter TaxID=196816 RepID=UPI0022EB121C|nr:MULTISPECIES: glycosyltransferase [unclassified Acinetobacter]MDA3556160.1 glycosyltransferase [Acinetobacter sp. AOR15_HL]MDA3571617.1 glycosyltransferase [Acinetobacter sp. AOR14_HL]